MSEFSSNYSRVNEKFNMLLTGNLVKTIRTHARLILIPFFQKVAITSTENESGETYPVLTGLAERIINEVFQEGELGYESAEKAEKKALAFVKTLSDWQKECIAFYFCTDDDLLEKLEDERPSSYYEDTPEEDWDKEMGLSIQASIRSMVSNEEWLASCLTSELIHLQDIFSTEDENCWDTSSIAYANESFESYTGTNIKLIPLPLDDFEYWEKIIEPTEEDLEDEEDETHADDEGDDLGQVAREWIDYIKEYNKPLYLELTHNGTLEQAAREKQNKYFRKLGALSSSDAYSVDQLTNHRLSLNNISTDIPEKEKSDPILQFDPKLLPFYWEWVEQYIQEGVYKFSDIAKNLYFKMGSKLKADFKTLKTAYITYYIKVESEEVASKMDNTLRSFTYEQIENEGKAAEEKEKANTKDSDNNELALKIEEYVHKQYRSHIKGDIIHYGKAMFSVDTLISCSIKTCIQNPEKDIYFIVDDLFDYFCT